MCIKCQKSKRNLVTQYQKSRELILHPRRDLFHKSYRKHENPIILQTRKIMKREKRTICRASIQNHLFYKGQSFCCLPSWMYIGILRSYRTANQKGQSQITSKCWGTLNVSIAQKTYQKFFKKLWLIEEKKISHHLVKLYRFLRNYSFLNLEIV